MLFPPVAQAFSLVPTSNDSAVPASRCGHGLNGPMARGDQPQRIADRAAQCRYAVRPCGSLLWVRARLPHERVGCQEGFAVCPWTSTRGLTR